MNCPFLKPIAITVCFCSAAIFVFPQCPDSAGLNITASLYTQQNGLSSNMLAGIAKDSTGYRYFLGIDGKWIRYDGVNFGLKVYDRFSFEHSGLNDFSTEKFTDLYTGNIHYRYGKNSKGNNYKWALNNDSLIWVSIPGNNSKAFQLPKGLNEPVDFFPGGESCWITTPDKVFRFDIRSEKFFSAGLPVIPEINLPDLRPTFIFSRNDDIPYLLLGKAVLKLNNNSGSFEKFCSLPQQPLTGLHEIIMNHYLFVAASNILYEINLDNGAVRKCDLTDYTGIKNSSALKITTLRNYHDYLLIGTSNAGLFIFNRCSGSMQHFQYEKQSSEGDLTNAIVWIEVNDENVIWMQTEAGLIKLEVNNQRIKAYLPSTVKTGGVCNNCNNVRAVYAYDNSNLLIGSLGGVCSFSLNSKQFSNLISPVDNRPVWDDHSISAITGDGNGTVFISSWNNEGILLLNTEKRKLINILQAKNNPELSYSFLQCLFYDSQHVLWVGTREGFLRITNLDEFQKNNFSGKINITDSFPGKHNNLPKYIGSCFAIAEDSNKNIWLGTVNGLYEYDYTKNSLVKYINVAGNSKSLRNNEVRSICISKNNNLWIGTNGGGLNYFDIAKKTFTAFTMENGLPNNSIYTILEDNNGFLWLGTNAGLCRFNKKDHSVRNYTPRDGIQSFEFNTNAVYKTPDGKFCFGGRTGFNIFHPDSMNLSFAPPKVVITQFKIFDKEFPVTDAVLNLNHDENTLTFDFASLSYYRSNDNQYAYMMEGADKDWIKSGNRHYTSYTNLPP
ncbi:MAG TPA: two-component regulator propeller domain-containing protein, partial [Panacibacter sp.]|nr:two-component regulator propeller domain-containing protein [Panacibacter sp.]